MQNFPKDILLERVGTNNLRQLDVKFPLGKFTVVTGVSGSGKSSLVFDSLYAESYRRYVESLSSFARQYLKALPKPVIGRVENLPPAVAINQAQLGGNSRSTVGTVTEVNDLLRILFTHASTIKCTTCDGVIIKDSGETAAKRVSAEFAGQKLTVTAPLSRWGKITAKELKSQLEAQGFVRAISNGELVRIGTLTAGDLKSSDVAIDRITINEESRTRLVDALEVALRLGRGKAQVREGVNIVANFSSALSCPDGHGDYIEPSPALLSFNHPLGACSNCQGFAYEPQLDWQKIIPDRQLSLSSNGVKPWNFGSHAAMYDVAKRSAKKHRIKLTKTFGEYTPDEWDWLQNGAEDDDFIGINGYFEWLERKKHKAHYRIHAARFRTYVKCTVCDGQRLRSEALACRILGKNLAEVCQMPFSDVINWLDEVEQELSNQKRILGPGAAWGLMGVDESLQELVMRVSYLNKIGVSYLNADRQTRTLSGGELQRIKMARCLGSALTDTLYCLDEPSSGLHARDSENLLKVIRELRDQGNTVVVVEHERELISGADHLLEIGPDAGHKGGQLVFSGPPHQSASHQPIKWSKRKHTSFAPSAMMKVKGASTHNLKQVDVEIPQGGFTVVCGVSGSGKTSLIQHTFYPLIAKELGQTKLDGIISEPQATGVGGRRAIAKHSQIVLVSQASIGRSSRSNIATYLGLLGGIRKLLANQPLAKAHRLTPGHFSFNSKGGRCEHCKGLGTVSEDLSFLGEMDVVCPVCEGLRFEERVLEVQFREKNLIEILKMTVDQAREFFFDRKDLVKAFDHVRSMGLGYISLGQQTSSFSGGEAQRLKLSRLLTETDKDKPAILIFDEPSTGLSDRDVLKLVEQLQHLADAGHSVVVVEHHLGMVQCADWVIEIGPEAGMLGGQKVFQGPPEQLYGCADSITAKYLSKREVLQ